MRIEHKKLGNTLYVGLAGELDECAAGEVRERLDEIVSGSYGRIVFDLAELNFMDSTGIGVLIGRYKKLKARGIPVLLSSPTRSVDRVLSLTGIYEIMPKIG